MDMFKPEIRVVIDRGGQTYSVYATVTVPSGCYISMGSALKAPEDVAIIAEAEAVSLYLTHTKKFCTQAIEYRSFVVHGIPISEAKRQVVAFTVLDAKTVASSAAAVPGGISDAAMLEPDGKDYGDDAELLSFSGWINAMPGEARKIVVVAVVHPEEANADYSLQRVGSFGFTGRTLLFKLVHTPGTTTGMIRYEEEDLGDFDSVALMYRRGIFIDDLDNIH